MGILLLTVAALGIFGWMDCYRISTGDDLGYMFTDSQLHAGDGVPVQGVGDCLLTQSRHYFTTNGRVPVHFTVQMMVGVMSPWVFTLCNTVMFGLLWWLTISVSGCRQRGAMLMLVTLGMLWLLLPVPGMTMLSLVAFSVGYMWTSVAGLAWLLMLRFVRERKKRLSRSRAWLLVCVSLLIAMLHEGMSLPICFAIAIWLCRHIYIIVKHRTGGLLTLLNTVEVAMMAAFLVGTLLIVLAPGNFAHLSGAGGFSSYALLRRQILLWPQVLTGSIGVLAIVLLLMLIFKPSAFGRALRANAFILCIIIGALLLAALSFTSPRQLFWPSTLGIVVLLRILWPALMRTAPEMRRSIAGALIVVLTALSAVTLWARRTDYQAWQQFLSDYQMVAKAGGNIVAYDITDALYNTHPALNMLLNRYTCNPAEDTTLHLFFDGYTKRGLSRLYCAGKSDGITHLIPSYRTAEGEECNLDIDIQHGDKIQPRRLDAKYSYIVLPANSNSRPWEDEKHDVFIPYEEEKTCNFRILYIPSKHKTVYLN